MQCLPTPVYLVSYIVAMQLLSPVRFHETYKNTKQKELSYELNDKLYQWVKLMKTSPSMITMVVRDVYMRALDTETQYSRGLRNGN